MTRRHGLAFFVALAAGVTGALGSVINRRQLSSPEQLREQYDFIIVGGGTTGLTVADRLSEALVDKTVLVIEYGEREYAPGIFDPPQIVWGGSSTRAGTWQFSSLPNAEFLNKSASVLAGRTVGGSSAINGMFFDRVSRFDLDAWAQVGSPEFDSSPHKWDYNGLFSYFKKGLTFTPPPASSVEKYGYTWNMSAWGGTTPIHASFPPFLWADNLVIREAWKEMGIRVNPECATGEKTGLCWIPLSEHPVTARRSHAGLGHYADVVGNNSAKPRTNYDLLAKHQVVRLIYPNGTQSGPPMVEVQAVNEMNPGSGRMFRITPKAEVIVSAGVFNTPMILHRSGIGPTAVLKKYGIPVVHDLPGVGSNLQDHSGSSISWNYSKPTGFYPLPSDMLNETFAAQAAADFDKIPAQGPYTLGMSNSAIFISLPNLTLTHQDMTSKIRAMANSSSLASYLPLEDRSSASLLLGYRAQLVAIADLLDNPSAPSLETAFATGTAPNAINLHPLSRGTVRLDPANHLAQPILDYRAASNPVDFDMYMAHVRYLRRMISSPALQEYGAVETAPTEAVAVNDTALLAYVKEKFTFSFMHPCCTASMLPLNKGGVVGPDLKVHGTEGLRVVDMSVLPLLPSSHLSQLAYAIGEKAADIIVGDWKGK